MGLSGQREDVWEGGWQERLNNNRRLMSKEVVVQDQDPSPSHDIFQAGTGSEPLTYPVFKFKIFSCAKRALIIRVE